MKTKLKITLAVETSRVMDCFIEVPSEFLDAGIGEFRKGLEEFYERKANAEVISVSRMETLHAELDDTIPRCKMDMTEAMTVIREVMDRNMA